RIGTDPGVANPSEFRMGITPYLGTSFDMRRRDLPYESYRRLIKQWRQIAPCYYGDYYPLTPYSTEDDAWVAWQFDRPDLGEGFVQVLARPASAFPESHLKLRGLAPQADYRVTDQDQPDKQRELTGKELTEAGLPVRIEHKPAAIIVAYRR